MSNGIVAMEFQHQIANQIVLMMADCGHRLLPNFIDEIASVNPSLTFVEIPKTDDVHDGLRQITFGDLARCIDKCAWWIHAQLGRRHGFPTLTYVGPHDLRCLFLVFGACKAGHKVRLPGNPLL